MFRSAFRQPTTYCSAIYWCLSYIASTSTVWSQRTFYGSTLWMITYWSRPQYSCRSNGYFQLSRFTFLTASQSCRPPALAEDRLVQDNTFLLKESTKSWKHYRSKSWMSKDVQSTGSINTDIVHGRHASILLSQTDNGSPTINHRNRMIAPRMNELKLLFSLPIFHLHNSIAQPSTYTPSDVNCKQTE